MRRKRNNRLGQKQDIPQPARPVEANPDYSITRMTDGHIAGGSGLDAGNAHYPNYEDPMEDYDFGWPDDDPNY